MKGVQFLVDVKGKPKSVLIDLEVWGELWEDMYDAMLAECNQGDDKIPWESVEAEIEAEAQRERPQHGGISN